MAVFATSLMPETEIVKVSK